MSIGLPASSVGLAELESVTKRRPEDPKGAMRRLDPTARRSSASGASLEVAELLGTTPTVGRRSRQDRAAPGRGTGPHAPFQLASSTHTDRHGSPPRRIRPLNAHHHGGLQFRGRSQDPRLHQLGRYLDPKGLSGFHVRTWEHRRAFSCLDLPHLEVEIKDTVLPFPRRPQTREKLDRDASWRDPQDPRAQPRFDPGESRALWESCARPAARSAAGVPVLPEYSRKNATGSHRTRHRRDRHGPCLSFVHYQRSLQRRPWSCSTTRRD